MSHIVAYLSFPGNCREAMNFYKESLGGELTMMAIADSPMGSQMPPEMGQQIMHSSLTSESITLMAADMNNNFSSGSAIHLCLVCDSNQQLNTYFEKLSVGGTVNHPVSTFFAGTIGDFQDKFGINWMLYYGEGMQQ
jgi:PhnB protein